MFNKILITIYTISTLFFFNNCKKEEELPDSNPVSKKTEKDSVDKTAKQGSSTKMDKIPAKTAKFIKEFGTISLPDPRKDRGIPLMKALNNRKTSRKFSLQQLPLQIISDLLWAASGINRPEGKMTAPTAANSQEIEIYLAHEKGLFYYQRKDHSLKPVLEKDVRVETGKQKFTDTAPLVLIYVGNYQKMDRPREKTEFYFATDTGFVSQNVYLFCASENLATVVIGWLDKEKLLEAMELDSKKYKVVLTQPVGFPAK
ncbi:MAG: SagB/ThcOx family dehydrogenase [Deltaproteobacteria bacterium]|jgi:SagB-type dehydrogenase family enzyme|nr:SagB/ThcOx family dehydrogenase [Deltaproteobacteria bacterium]